MDYSPASPELIQSPDRLRQGIHAGRDETRHLVDSVLGGTVDLELFGQWLLALADLGESADEIAGVAEACCGCLAAAAVCPPAAAPTGMAS